MTIIGYAVAWLDDFDTTPVWRLVRDTCTYTPMDREHAEDYLRRCGFDGFDVRIATITIPDKEASK